MAHDRGAEGGAGAGWVLCWMYVFGEGGPRIGPRYQMVVGGDVQMAVYWLRRYRPHGRSGYARDAFGRLRPFVRYICWLQWCGPREETPMQVFALYGMQPPGPW